MSDSLFVVSRVSLDPGSISVQAEVMYAFIIDLKRILYMYVVC